MGMADVGGNDDHGPAGVVGDRCVVVFDDVIVVRDGVVVVRDGVVVPVVVGAISAASTQNPLLQYIGGWWFAIKTVR